MQDLTIHMFNEIRTQASDASAQAQNDSLSREAAQQRSNDIGQVWESWSVADTEFSIGVGFGVRWSTPIGPLWADIAWPVANVGISSSKPKFYLGIGRPF